MSERTSERRNLLKGLAFLSPWLVGFLAFTFIPILFSFYLSFCDYPGLQPPVFRGLANYREIFNDDLFWISLRNMLSFVAIALPLGLVVTLSTAMLLNSKIKGQSFYRTIIFLPSILPAVASAMIWLWLLNGDQGIINQMLTPILSGVNRFLSNFHVMPSHAPNWLTDTRWALPSLAMMTIWSAGNTVIIYLAGLQEVPKDLYEAADLDGAGLFGKTLHITLPTISPVIFFNVIIGIINLIQVFLQPYIMTLGGPDRSTYMPTMLIYDNTFSYLKMGTASALAWIMFLVILSLTGLAFWSSRRWVHYQGD